MWVDPSPPGSLAIHSLPPPAVDCWYCPWEGEGAGGLVVTGSPPPRKLKTLGQPGGGLGQAQRGPLCSLAGLPTGFWGRQQEPVSVPFCFLRRPPECPEPWPSVACPAHPQPLPLFLPGPWGTQSLRATPKILEDLRGFPMLTWASSSNRSPSLHVP
jgi:hypothetical protein